MHRTGWWKLQKSPKIKLKKIIPKRVLENRIVLCTDCDCSRALAVSSGGKLICSSCGSENWMFVSTPIIAKFKNYDEQEIQECVAVDQYIAKLEREKILVPLGALL